MAKFIIMLEVEDDPQIDELYLHESLCQVIHEGYHSLTRVVEDIQVIGEIIETAKT